MTEVPPSAEALDAADPLAGWRDRFVLGRDVVYLDGNSLGPLPVGVAERVGHAVTDEWGHSLIRGWNEHGWLDLPLRVGDRIGRLIGAPAGSVVAADTTSINLAKALSAGLRLRPDRTVVLSDTGNFPTDLYVAQGLLRTLGGHHELRLVDPDGVADAIDRDLAVLALTEVDYRTGRLHDMAALTARAHDAGGLALWDLAHSVGALPVDVTAARADFAVGCTYKYLNGGPGAPAFVYVAPAHAEAVEPLLSGWMGHEAPFAFDLDYRPAAGTQRLRVGTPGVIALSALDAALDCFEGVDLDVVRSKSLTLSERFIAGVADRCAGHGLELASPRDPLRRGSHVSFAHPHGYAVVQALIADGVIADFRAPDLMRFGFAPLYVRHQDVDIAVERLGIVLAERRWDRPEHRRRARVT